DVIFLFFSFLFFSFLSIPFLLVRRPWVGGGRTHTKTKKRGKRWTGDKMVTGQSIGMAIALPLVGALGWTAYTSRGVRNVVVRNPLDISPYCREAAAKTRQDGISCLICAFEMPVVVSTAKMRRELTCHPSDGALYALHALLSGCFMRMEVIATAFTSRWRVSDVYFCWRSISRSVLAENRRVAIQQQKQQQQQQCGHHTSDFVDLSATYGEWDVLCTQNENSDGCKEVVLTHGPEAIIVSLEPVVEGSRQVVLRLCYLVQPFDGFERNTMAERVALWGAEKYGKLLTAQTAYALEKMETF
ncbi:succinate dehydrogenase flavoprotein subunit, partial [Trypanosoma cruzi marinkellei]